MRLLLKGFACYRIAKMITDTEEKGPFDSLHKFRSFVGVYDLGPDGTPQGQLGKLFHCPYCVGVWLGLILALAPENKYIDFVINCFAIAGLQAYMQKTVE